VPEQDATSPTAGTPFKELLRNPAFPRSSTYDAAWVLENQMGPSALWLTEWLAERLPLDAGMRVLDMGCGRCLSSVFLARERGVRVWANDLWIPASENWRRVVAAGLGDAICPIHAEAHALPYADGFFDAAVSLDSYHYYGTDDNYLGYFVRFVRPGGRIGIVVPALMRDLPEELPDHLTRRQRSGGVFWNPAECFSFHTCAWWEAHWARSGLVEIECADVLPDGWNHWLQWERAIERWGRSPFPSDAEAIEADAGRYLGFVRLVARRIG
jgi:SAM-dependent methyltransferase